MKSKALDRLAKETREALAKRSLNGSWDATTLLAVLADIDKWDSMIDVRKKRANRILKTGTVCSVIGILVLIIVLISDASWKAFWIGLAVNGVFVGLAVWGNRLLRNAKAVDVPDEIRLSLLPVVRQLKQDLHPGRKIRTRLNLQAFDENVSRSTRDLPPGRHKRLRQNIYDEPIGVVRLPLADGSTAVIKMDNTFQRLVRDYTSRSGKSKTKTKWKKQTTVTCVLIPESPSVLWDPKRAKKFVDPQHEHISFAPKQGVNTARLDRYYTFKTLTDPPADTCPPAQILKMLICLNTIRTPRRKDASTPGGQGR